MNRFQIDAKVVKTECLAPDVYRITFAAYDIAKHAQPGQFVMLRMSHGLDPLLRRPFSIHQVTDNGNLQILFKVIGRGTKYLSGLKSGASIDIVGPLGNMFQHQREGRHCLVGGGMGIAPLLFLAKALLRQHQPPEIKIILGARNREEIAKLLLDFGELGVELYHTTDDGSSGHHGFVTDLLERVCEKNNKWNIHCCGPRPMMAKVADICAGNKWPCWVSMETVMACGIGACLGCTIRASELNHSADKKYFQVCKDGPIFKAETISW